MFSLVWLTLVFSSLQKPSLPFDNYCVATLKHHPRKTTFGDMSLPLPVSQTSVDSDDSDTDPVTDTSVPRPSPLRPTGKGVALKLKGDSSSPGSKVQSTGVKEETVKSTDSEALSDEYAGKGKVKKTVAIDTTQNEHFSQRLIPAQSPEFDNVINQVRDEHFIEGIYSIELFNRLSCFP